MTLRAIIIGIALGLLVSGTTYYNDFFVRQSSLINHLLPISIIGFVIFLLLIVNPLLSIIRQGRMLKATEIGVITALGLVACTWPGAGFFRTATTNLVMPGNNYPREPSWQGKELMAYVPDASPRLGHGHVTDWPTLIAFVNAGEAEDAPPQAQAVWSVLTERERRDFLAAAAAENYDKQPLLTAVNHVITQGTLARPNEMSTAMSPDLQTRLKLVELLPQAIKPPPSGQGVLFDDGRQSEHTDALVFGQNPDQPIGLTQLPWDQWTGPARLWGLAALLLGAAALCLSLIVHTQWSRHELLPYPIPRFLEEIAPRQSGRALPEIAYKQSFWIGLALVLCVHLLGGLQAWFPSMPAIPRYLHLNALGSLVPDAAKIADIQAYLRPAFYFTAIALAFFLTRSVSFSIGVAPFCYVVLATIMLKRGEVLQNEYLGAGASNMLRFGAWLAMAGVIAYTGRRYYLRLIAAAAGTPNLRVDPSSVWAARVLVVVVAMTVAILTTGGLSWVFATLVVLLILLIFLVLARIVAETGLFFIQPYWMPVGILTALFGFEVIGPTTYILMALSSTMLVGDVRTALLGNLVNAFKIVESTGEKRPARLTPWIVVMLLSGFVVAAAATLYLQYNYGLGNTDRFTRSILPAMPFEQLARHISDAQMVGTLDIASFHDGRLNLGDTFFDPALCGWLLTGIVLLVGVSVIRLRVSWCPLHPIIFLIWGTFPANRFAASFLAGWAIKSVVMWVGGATAYRAILPAMVGLVVGDITAAFLWIAVGAIYHFTTGQTPASYMVF